MKINIATPVRAITGWDIDVNVQADADEKIAYVEVRVNDFQEAEDRLRPPFDSWEQTLQRKGQYPGDNKVDVLVRDENDKETRAERKWS